MTQTPYTTKAGVQIGLLYEPSRVYPPDAHMERLQEALIGSGVQLLPFNWMQVVDGFLWMLSFVITTGMFMIGWNLFP